MGDLLTASLVALATGILVKLVDNLLERRRAGSTDRRADEASALAQVQAVWNELRQLKEDHEEEIRLIRVEHATMIKLYKYRIGQAGKRVLLAEQERDRVLAELEPLKVEVAALRRRVKELEEASHG